jgi:oxysterol-binding protein-related protein 3/6/7
LFLVFVDLLTLNSINSRSTDNLSVTEFVGESSPQLNNVEQLKRSQKLKIGELIEILPIRKYNSFEYTLEGSFTIPLTGTYVLLFDNSFSIGTSKHLFYHAYLSSDIIPSPSATPQLLSIGQVGSLCAAGWLSKKRTGVVRSWSRRWFQLDSLGVLSYFEDRASPLRGSIFVPDCSLIIAKNSLKFSLDSGSQIFHLQAYKREEFDFWIQVLSSFKHFGPPTTLTSSHQLPKKFQVQADAKSSVKSKLDETFKFVRGRLDSMTKKEPAEVVEIGETLMKLETIYNLLQRTREELEAEAEDGEKAEETEEYSDVTEEYEEVFYDVEEIYVDDIEEEGEEDIESFGGAEEEEEEIFEAAIEQEEIKQVAHAPLRTVTDWILKADLNLPRDDTVIYRTNMPFPAPPINISFASVIMRKSFPVALNEPINLLQRLAEELEYSELLDKAAGMVGDAVEQLVYVTAFAVSGYAATIHRSERKPYNPVLGETFEYIRPDRGYRFISEKVSHQPVIVACHGESKKWRFWQDLQAETKLWGKSMLITPKGKIHLELLDEESGEVRSYFVWSKVSGALRNVYSSKKSIENYGDLVIKNRSAGLESRITFKESGMFSNSGNEIQGGIYKSGHEDEIVTLSGRWDDMLCKEIKEGKEGKKLFEVIWKTNLLPSNYAQFFHLTSFAVTLNDFPDLLRRVLPASDSRYRPDQRMLESGMVDAADIEKQRLEQLQRERRNSSNPIEPLWFKFDERSRSWKFNEKYWKERERNFSHTKIPKLW